MGLRSEFLFEKVKHGADPSRWDQGVHIIQESEEKLSGLKVLLCSLEWRPLSHGEKRWHQGISFAPRPQLG